MYKTSRNTHWPSTCSTAGMPPGGLPVIDNSGHRVLHPLTVVLTHILAESRA